MPCSESPSSSSQQSMGEVCGYLGGVLVSPPEAAADALCMVRHLLLVCVVLPGKFGHQQGLEQFEAILCRPGGRPSLSPSSCVIGCFCAFLVLFCHEQLLHRVPAEPQAMVGTWKPVNQPETLLSLIDHIAT